MGTAGSVFHVLFRVTELICSVIVLGLDGRLLWLVGQAGSYSDARLVYTIVIASLSTAFSLIFILPLIYAFYAFPIDFIFFVLWFVDFVLLQVLTGVNTCEASWYWNYWGYYWGGFWRLRVPVRGPWDIGWSGCSSWRAVLAFSFIASMAYLASSGLGAYETMKHRDRKRSGAQEHDSPNAMLTREAPAGMRGEAVRANNASHGSSSAGAAPSPVVAM